MLGPYIKSRGTRGSKMSANADLITIETYVQQGNSVARDLPPTGSEANTTICFFYIYIGYRFPLSLYLLLFFYETKNI